MEPVKAFFMKKVGIPVWAFFAVGVVLFYIR